MDWRSPYLSKVRRRVFHKGPPTFPASKLALTYLSKMSGIEIGGAAHNPFHLKTLNVDIAPKQCWVDKQRELCGRVLPIDVLVESGDKLPFPDKSFDFVISSHVIEHFYDPIAALKEWVRVAKRYVYLIAPHVDRTFDRGRDVTSVQELFDRHSGAVLHPDRNESRHWSVWRTQDFLELVQALHLPVAAHLDTDDKVGNGFAVLIGDLRG